MNLVWKTSGSSQRISGSLENMYIYIYGFVHSFTPELRVSATGSEALQIQAWEFKQHFHNESWNLVGKSHPQGIPFQNDKMSFQGGWNMVKMLATYLQIDSGIWLGSSWMNQAKQIVSVWWYEWSMRRRSAMPVRCYWRRSCGWNQLADCLLTFLETDTLPILMVVETLWWLLI